MTEGLLFPQEYFSTWTKEPVNNSLLTGYKMHVSCDKTSMSHDKNVDWLNDVTCRTTLFE